MSELYEFDSDSVLIVRVVLLFFLQGLQLMTTVSQPVYDTKNDTVLQSH